MSPRIRILNGQFDALTLPQTVDAVFQQLNDGRRGWLCTVNVAILVMMKEDPKLQSFVDNASIIVADGQPLVWCAPMFGHSLPERVTGVDLVDSICERAMRQQKKVYLLGATTEIVSSVAARLHDRYPTLAIEYADGYFPLRDAAARADEVRRAGADILFVAMGVPRQETFIQEQWNRLGVGVAIGVGGSFDVLAGVRSRAPGWIQRVGLEWLYRLIQEPKRLFMRYLVTNSKFAYLVFREIIRKVCVN
jgi:N-acetylglucosaminyldiphosphoundecaprenol N-acetyl-beta-D-mannosaminyltransferase